MPWSHDTPVTIQDIFNEVANNLWDAGLKRITEDDILRSLQSQYNLLVAALTPIEQTTFIPQISSPYYNLGAQIPNYMYLSAVYNPTINMWLEGHTYKDLKSMYQTYMAIGNHRYFNVTDMYRVQFWPYPNAASGVLFIVYKAKAPSISYSHVPQFPLSVSQQLLEYSTTADLMEQEREFKKAQLWWDRLYLPGSREKSVYAQAEQEIKDLARTDRLMVLEPYRWLFHAGGTYTDMSWICNETPVGTIDGLNTTFTLAQIPNPTSSLLLMKNGQTLFNGEGYTLAGNTLTLNSPYTPNVGDILRAWYQV